MKIGYAFVYRVMKMHFAGFVDSGDYIGIVPFVYILRYCGAHRPVAALSKISIIFSRRFCFFYLVVFVKEKPVIRSDNAD